MTFSTKMDYEAIGKHLVSTMLDYDGTTVYSDILNENGCYDLADLVSFPSEYFEGLHYSHYDRNNKHVVVPFDSNGKKKVIYLTCWLHSKMISSDTRDPNNWYALSAQEFKDYIVQHDLLLAKTVVTCPKLGDIDPEPI